jgi:hypothetical protein
VDSHLPHRHLHPAHKAVEVEYRHMHQ